MSTAGIWMNKNWNRLADLTKKRYEKRATAKELDEIPMRIALQNMFSCGNEDEAVRLVELSFKKGGC